MAVPPGGKQCNQAIRSDGPLVLIRTGDRAGLLLPGVYQYARFGRLIAASSVIATFFEIVAANN